MSVNLNGNAVPVALTQGTITVIDPGDRGVTSFFPAKVPGTGKSWGDNLIGLLNGWLRFEGLGRGWSHQAKGIMYTALPPLPANITIPYEQEVQLSKYEIFNAQYSIGKSVPKIGALRYMRGAVGVVDLVNMSIAELFLMALTTDDVMTIRYNRLNIESLPQSTQSLVLPPFPTLAVWDESFQHRWRKDHAYTFVQRTHFNHERVKYTVLLDNLNSFFKLHFNIMGEIDMQPLEAICLVRITDEPIPNVPSGPTEIFVGTELELSNVRLSRLVARIDSRCIFTPGLPVIDCTGYNDLVSIKVNWNFKDPMELNQALGSYGLRLVKQIRPVPMMKLRKC